MSQKQPVHRLISIDPGMTCLGISISDLTDEGMFVHHTATLLVEGMQKIVYDGHHPWGTAYLKEKIVSDFVTSMIHAWRPSALCIETPYVGLSQNVSSYVVLMNCLRVVKRAAMETAPMLPILPIDPSSAKYAANIPRDRFKDKEAVGEYLLALPYLDLSEVFPEQFDEHSWDSILIGNAYYINWKRGRPFHGLQQISDPVK